MYRRAPPPWRLAEAVGAWAAPWAAAFPSCTSESPLSRSGFMTTALPGCCGTAAGNAAERWSFGGCAAKGR